MKKKKIQKKAPKKIFQYLTNAVIILAIIGLLSTIFPIIKSEISFRLKNQKEKIYIPNKVSSDSLPKANLLAVTKKNGPRIIYPIDPSFDIIIPKIDVNYPIIANVNPYDSKEFTEKLKQGIAQAKGTDFPGSGRKIYLFSHSSSNFWEGRANVAFYLLKDLSVKDKVYIFYRNLRYDYEVIEKVITNKNDIKYLTKDLNKDELILQTCYPPGTDWQRLIIIAKQI